MLRHLSAALISFLVKHCIAENVPGPFFCLFGLFCGAPTGMGSLLVPQVGGGGVL